MPKKRSKKNPLSASDKAKNRDISSERVPCENVIAMLKRFKIIADRYRNRRRRFGLRFFLIAAIYNKELQLPWGYARGLLLIRSQKWSALRAWGMKIAKRRGMAKARIAVARKLATILHRMWIDATGFRFGREQPIAPVAGGRSGLRRKATVIK
jgi:hypothetical protein